ncbi:phospholipase A [Crenobacter cavernae]|uniref:Phospholipase A1 n=1 Tax=Crenobacter cavernae TaxID=2290923 RepID=A0A345Y2Z6_9NEIS|nr:phospholipase A [Crenobacter cavernae]AXK38298.1 phospholipase [Crenobacter cavernae]
MRSSLFLVLLPFAIALPARAVSLTDALAGCRALYDGNARLKCYDGLGVPGVASAVSDGAVTVSSLAALAELVPAPVEPQEVTPRPSEVIADTVKPPPSALSHQWDLDDDDARGTFVLRAYRPTYVLPVWYNARPNGTPETPTQDTATIFGDELKNTEAKLQISLKTKVWQNVLGTPVDLWFGYTQQSHWQVYNKQWSAPFRETDYEPEAIATLPVDAKLPLGWRWRLAGLGLVHQSNGQTDPESRSWNRVYAMAGLENGPVNVVGRVWYRLPESAVRDNNPDIVDYMGHGDLSVYYQRARHTLGATARYNPGSGKGALQLDWTFPVAGRLKGYLQAFDGYGESLLDYNHHNRGIGVGLMLNDWMEH